MDEVKIRVKEEQVLDNLTCNQCDKTFPKPTDLELHAKNKHEGQKEKENGKEKQSSKPRHGKGQPRNRMHQMSQNEHEDLIYAYLGELGEKNQQNGSKDQIIMAQENQKQIIQTNYSFNKVVRTPYEKEINPQDNLPNSFIDNSSNRDFIRVLVAELIEFNQKLELEKQKWEFRDPMAPEEEAEDEFSLIQIRKLILNYPRRKIVATCPHFSIFILWIGRICKPPAWKQFFIIISSFLAEYHKREKTQTEATVRWKQYSQQFLTTGLKKQVQDQLTICDQRTVKKFCEYFVKWVQVFELVEQFC